MRQPPPKRMSKEMGLFLYYTHLDLWTTRLASALGGLAFYFVVTPYCEDKSCYTDALKYDRVVWKIIDKLRDIKLAFCCGDKTFKETLQDLKLVSKSFIKLQGELEKYYKKCEPYIIPYAETRKGWPVPITCAGQEIEVIREFTEDTTFEEFVYGNWKEVITSLIEYYEVVWPTHIEGFKRYALGECPILELIEKQKSNSGEACKTYK